MDFRAGITPQIGLGSLCGILLTACVFEAWAPLPDVVAPDYPARTRSAQRPLSIAFALPTIRTFDAINDRPIFSPDRKAIAPAAVATSAAPPPPPSAALVGVILDNQTRLALMKSSAAPLETAYAVGAMVDGWQVSEIDRDKVVLRSGLTTDEIKLEANRAAKSDRPAAAAIAVTQEPNSVMGRRRQGVNPTSAAPQVPAPEVAHPQPSGQ